MHSAMDMALRLGLIKPFTQESGKIMSPMVEESLLTLLGIFIRVSGSTQRLMVRASLSESAGIPIWEHG